MSGGVLGEWIACFGWLAIKEIPIKEWLLNFAAGSFGFISSAGVFTVFVAVGLIPRFAGKTHTADHVVLYEEMVIAGTIFGGIISIFQEYLQIGRWLGITVMDNFNPAIRLGNELGNGVLLGNELGNGILLGNGLLCIFGLGAGMFIGCLALAIAEILDSIPILSRRIGFRHGIGLAVISMALGKLVGSFLYFYD